MDKRLVRIGLNGFGRIGRAIFRVSQKNNAFEVPVINELNPDNLQIGYLLKNDSTYGRFQGTVSATESSLHVNSKEIALYHERNIADVPWKNHDVSFIIDNSGCADNIPQIRNIDASVKNIIVTNAPDHPEVRPVVFGCNETEIIPTKSRILSSSICDAIALSPIAKLLDNTVGIESGHLTTLHPWLGNQNLLDGTYGKWNERGEMFSNFTLGRSAMNNLLPKTTTAVQAADKVLPGLEQIVSSVSYRVPTSIVCSAVLVFTAKRDTTREEIQALFMASENSQKYQILKNNSETLISGDFTGEEHSAVVDQRWISVMGKRHVRIMYWYDNEWGYSSRVVDLVTLLSQWYQQNGVNQEAIDRKVA